MPRNSKVLHIITLLKSYWNVIHDIRYLLKNGVQYLSCSRALFFALSNIRFYLRALGVFRWHWDNWIIDSTAPSTRNAKPMNIKKLHTLIL